MGVVSRKQMKNKWLGRFAVALLEVLTAKLARANFWASQMSFISHLAFWDTVVSKCKPLIARASVLYKLECRPFSQGIQGTSLTKPVSYSQYVPVLHPPHYSSFEEYPPINDHHS